MLAQSVVVVVFALLWAIAEIAYTFPRETVVTLICQGPSWALICLNVIVAVVLLLLTKLSLDRLDRSSDNIYLAAAIGFSYPSLLRSQVAHFGKIGLSQSEGQALSRFTFSLGKPYSRLQERYRKKLDHALSADASVRTHDLQDRFSAQILHEAISSLCDHLQVPEARDAEKKYLKKIEGITEQNEKHKMLATMLVMNYAPATYEKVLRALVKRHTPKQTAPVVKHDPA